MAITVASAAQEGFGVLLGVAIVGGGIFLFIRRNKGKPSDAEVDAWLRQSIEDVAEESINRLGLPVTYESDGSRSKESLQTLTLQGPNVWSRPGIDNNDIVFKKGKDDLVRFGTYRLVVLHLTTHHLTSYQCDYNFLRDVALNVETDEYPYEHIVTVSTREEASSFTLPTGVKMTHSEQFRISVSSGEAITVAVNFPELRRQPKPTPYFPMALVYNALMQL